MKIERRKRLYVFFVFMVLLCSFLLAVIPNCALADNDGNDDFANAEAIISGTTEGAINKQDTDDYFKIEVPSASIINMEYTGPLVGTQLLSLYNSAEEEAVVLQSLDGATVTDKYYLSAETPTDTWYIHIYGAPGEYIFKISFTNQNDGGSGSDVYESFDNAYTITAGTEINGHIEDLDTTDMYKFEAGSSDIITVDYTGPAAGTQSLFLYSPDKEEMFELKSVDGSDETDKFYLANETEKDFGYIMITGDEGSYTFTVTLTKQNDAGSGVDVAADFDRAHSLTTGAELNGHIEDLDTVDMYKFKMGSSAIATVEFTCKANATQTLTLYGPAKQVIFNLSSTNSGKKTDKYYLANETAMGTWYIKVTGDFGGYTFKAAIGSQDDAGSGVDVASAFETAYVIAKNTAVTGHLEDLDTSDMYKILVNGPYKVNVKFNGINSKQMTLVIYDNNKGELFQLKSVNGTVESQTVIVLGQNDTYCYIYVKDGTGSYSITATLSPSATPPGPPTEVKAKAGEGKVTLTWLAPADDGGAAITGYKIYRGNASGINVEYATVDNLTTTYKDTEVENGVTYYYVVCAINEIGEGPISNEASAKPEKKEDKKSTPGFECIVLFAAICVVLVMSRRLRK